MTQPPVAWQYRHRGDPTWIDCTKDRYDHMATMPDDYVVRELFAVPPPVAQEPALCDADDPRFREAFEATVRACALPLHRLGEGYRSSYTQTAFMLAFGTVNRLLAAAPAVAQEPAGQRLKPHSGWEVNPEEAEREAKAGMRRIRSIVAQLGDENSDAAERAFALLRYVAGLDAAPAVAQPPVTIDDVVQAWHEGRLKGNFRELLGMTPEQYVGWLRPDPWLRAVLAECMRIEGCFKESDPAGTVACLIDWHVRNAAVAQPQGDLTYLIEQLSIAGFDHGQAELGKDDDAKKAAWAHRREVEAALVKLLREQGRIPPHPPAVAQEPDGMMRVEWQRQHDEMIERVCQAAMHARSARNHGEHVERAERNLTSAKLALSTHFRVAVRDAALAAPVVAQEARDAALECRHDWQPHKVGSTTYQYIDRCTRCGALRDRA